MSTQALRARLVAQVAACLLLPAAVLAQAPAGFVETTDSVEVRAPLTATQIQALLPPRGTFTFPAPYNTTAIRLTNPGDCGGGNCVAGVGYAYWRNINNHAGSDTMLVFLTLDRNRGGTGPTLFRYDKVAGQVTNLGPLFDAASPFSWATGEGWYFSATRPTTLYVNLPVTSSLLRYDVDRQTFTTVFDVASRPDLFGPNRAIRQFHSSDDDRVHSATLQDATTYAPLGCLAYREDTQQFFFFPQRGIAYDECQVDKSGRWLLIKEKLGSDAASDVDNRIIDLTTAVETDLLDRDGAGGHSDNGYGYMVAADNWHPLPNAYRLWRFDESPLQGRVVYSDPSWAATSILHVSHANATPSTPPEQQYACASGASAVPGPRANEIVCFPLDGSRRVLVVAPVMTDLRAPGGGSAYWKQPKGNLDVTGRYFIWTSNMAGDRLDAFIVQIPAAVLASGLGVSLTSPLTGATVSGGLVPIVASGGSSAGMAGVQFTLDGVNLGTEVTTPPYSMLWDSRTIPDGVHTLVAVARDAAGNIARSAPVTVTVKNAVRIEETDPTVRAGPCAWAPITVARASAGRTKQSSAAGAQAVVDFVGTGVSWIGSHDAASGIANVYLDGRLTATVDTFSALAQDQAVLFTVSGLSIGGHRLVVEVTGTHQLLAVGSSISVDAFDVLSADGSVTRLEETAPAVFTGPCAWYPIASVVYSGGGAISSAQAGAQVDVDFIGTGVRWLGYRDGWSGVAAVSIDGVLQAEIDTYIASTQAQAEIFKAVGLPSGNHRLTIQVTGRQNPASGGAWVVVDALEVLP